MCRLVTQNDFNELGNETIKLRPFNQNDLNDLTTKVNPEVGVIHRLTAGITAEGISSFLSRSAREHEDSPIASFYLAILGPELKGVLYIAYSDLRKYNLAAQWWIHGIWIFDQFTGQGIGFSALSLICNHLQKLSPVEIAADIHITNTASICIFKKAGLSKSLEEENGRALFKKLP